MSIVGWSGGNTILVDNTTNAITNCILTKNFIRHFETGTMNTMLVTGVNTGPNIKLLSNVFYCTGALQGAPLKLARGNNIIMMENVFNLIKSTGSDISPIIIESPVNSGNLLFHNMELGGELTGILLNSVSGWTNIGHHSSRNLFTGTGSFKGVSFVSTGVLFSGTFI